VPSFIIVKSCRDCKIFHCVTSLLIFSQTVYRFTSILYQKRCTLVNYIKGVKRIFFKFF
jgi:hypothetical protein